MASFTAKDRYSAEDLIHIVALLRDPKDGCPWDSVQTHASIRKNFLEETYEVLEAIDADDPDMLCEELGDVMMQVALHSCMEQEKGNFDFDDVCDGVCKKLIYRHPHIFADAQTQKNGIKDWDALKNKEKGRTGLADELQAVPVTLPALMKAENLQKRAAHYGAVTDTSAQAQAELQQAEMALTQALAADDAADSAQQAAGAYLFAAVNLLRTKGIDAEEALELYAKQFAGDAAKK